MRIHGEVDERWGRLAGGGEASPGQDQGGDDGGAGQRERDRDERCVVLCRWHDQRGDSEKSCGREGEDAAENAG